MQITFRMRPPLFTSPKFWYFFAHFDVETMTFTEPMFLVPSTFVHKHARRGKSIGKSGIPFQIKASLAPDARDKWTPFRVTRAELGPRILEILTKLEASSAIMKLELAENPNALLISKRRHGRPSTLRRAA